MSYDPKAIANFFIEAAEAEDKRLTPLQVIKLVYIAHGWYLGLTGEPLINEHPEAWEYGPVIPSLYHEFKIFGRGPITKKATAFVGEGIGEDYFLNLEEREVSPPNPQEDRATCDFLARIWDEYKRFSGSQLSTLTHQPNTPWHMTWNQRGKYQKGVDIPEHLILDHYRELRERNGRTQTSGA